MSRGRRAERLRRAGAAAVTVGVTVGTALTGLLATPAMAQARTASPPSPVSIDVVSVSPSVPAPSMKLRRLRIELSITNHTNTTLRHVAITATRALPLTSTTELASAIARPTPPASGQPVAPVRPVTVNLPPASQSGPVTATFTTTTGVPVQLNPGICLCQDGQVYPVWFTASRTLGGTAQVLGQAETFVPSFYAHPKPVHVSWVWPLIDRPHRLVGSTTFTDDSLAVSVSTGRLSRCLDVLENVAGRVPITVVVDPELLDELEIMATSSYRYRNSAGQLVPGTGTQAAKDWLARFQAVLQNDNQVSVVLTPNADPDVNSLAHAQLSWAAALPATEEHRVQAALGGITPSSTFAWPPSQTIGRTALRELYGTGVTSLLLSTDSVAANQSTSEPFTLARIANGRHPVVAALTSPALAQYAANAVTGTAGNRLTQLMAELALEVGKQNPAGEQFFLAPPRYVDPAVSLASQAIERSSNSVLTRPANLLNVLAAAATEPLQEPPVAVPGHLVAPRQSGPGLPPANLRIARHVTNAIASLKGMFDGSAQAETFVNQLYDAVQRIESAAWRRGSGLGGRPLGVKFARQLRSNVRDLIQSVHIVLPASGSYTLASTNSPLPITVENDLPYPVHVQVAVRTANGIPGLNARAPVAQEIGPNSKTTLHVPTQVQRSGLFRVYAILQTPDGRQFGPRVPLKVSSTVLGTIGVVITVVSGAILALALLIRFVRRFVARRNQPRPQWTRGRAPAPTAEDATGVAPLTATGASGGSANFASPGAASPPAAPSQ